MRQHFDRLLENFVAALFAVLCLLVLASVIARYVFNAPFMWSDELVIYLFTWIVFLGSALAYKNRRHISISIFTSRVPETVQKVIDLMGELLVLAFLLLLTGEGFQLTQLNADIQAVTIPIPVAVLNISLPLAGLIMIYYNLCGLTEKLKSFRTTSATASLSQR